MVASLGWFIGYYMLDSIKEIAQPQTGFREEERTIVRVVSIMMMVIDTVIMLSPTIVLYYGYPTTALVIFGILGVINSMGVTMAVTEAGHVDSFPIKMIVIFHYLLTQIPYLVLLAIIRFS